MGGKRAGKRKYLLLYLACFIVVAGTVAGCGANGTISPKAEQPIIAANPDPRAADLYRQGLILGPSRESGFGL